MLNRLSGLALPAFVLCMVALALRGGLFSSNPLVVACQLFGVFLLIWARTTFPGGSFRVTSAPASTNVLRTGPYRFVRHPMYSGALLILWASIAAHPSKVNVGIGTFGSLVVLGKILLEERMLRTSCPGYTEYAGRTKALIPFLL